MIDLSGIFSFSFFVWLLGILSVASFVVSME